jgi:hypothetical protein
MTCRMLIDREINQTHICYPLSKVPASVTPFDAPCLADAKMDLATSIQQVFDDLTTRLRTPNDQHRAARQLL